MTSAAVGPAGPRRRLGAELRRLRGKAGLHLDDVATLMQCSASKISRLETGKGIPKVPDVRELMRIYRVADGPESEMLLRLVDEGRTHGWWEKYTDAVQPERFVLDRPGRYTALETAARAVRSFDLSVLHGLLQTPEYTRAVMRTMLPAHAEEEIERIVALRRERRAALTERTPPLELEAVVDEAVLWRIVESRALMAAQVDAVLTAAARPNITVRVLPFRAGFHRAHLGNFVLLEFPPGAGTDCAHVEGHAGDTYLENRSDVDLYKDVLADAAERALDPESTADLLRRYRRDYAASKGSPP